MPHLGEVAERLRRSTVQVCQPGQPHGSGSGVILDSGGSVVTNAHVLRSGTAEVRFWDGTALQATVAKLDRRRDLAELRVRASALPAASLSESKASRPGELVLAVGNPLGFVGAVSTGVVHATGPLPESGPRIWVQSTVRLAPGNSGGPLANAGGEVIGINTMIVAAGAGQMLSLAVPAATVRYFVQSRGSNDVALGITVRPVVVPNENAPGFLILSTTPAMPADSASLLIGDLILGVNGVRFRNYSDLDAALQNATGGSLSVQFRRGGSPHDRTVTVNLERRRHAA